MKQETKEKYEAKINALESEKGELSANLKTQEAQYREELELLRTTSGVKEAELGETIKNLKNQVDRKETKKLAQAYEDQEKIYAADASRWLKWFFMAVFLLFLSACASVIISVNSTKKWYERSEYYVFDIILVSATWFCGAQYTDFTKLRNDYANRRTLAQSFHNILTNLEEDDDIKDKFIEKATDVLCSPNIITDKEPVLSKKIAKEVGEVLKEIAKNKLQS